MITISSAIGPLKGRQLAYGAPGVSVGAQGVVVHVRGQDEPVEEAGAVLEEVGLPLVITEGYGVDPVHAPQLGFKGNRDHLGHRLHMAYRGDRAEFAR